MRSRRGWRAILSWIAHAITTGRHAVAWTERSVFTGVADAIPTAWQHRGAVPGVKEGRFTVKLGVAGAVSDPCGIHAGLAITSHDFTNIAGCPQAVF